MDDVLYKLARKAQGMNISTRFLTRTITHLYIKCLPWLREDTTYTGADARITGFTYERLLTRWSRWGKHLAYKHTYKKSSPPELA
jgi:hypothetical protein